MTVSDLVMGFIRKEGDLIAQKLREDDEMAIEAPFSDHFSLLEQPIKDRLEKLLDDYNRLVLVLTYPPEKVHPSIIMHYFNRIDVSLDSRARKLLINRMLSHRSFENCAEVISDSCMTLNDVEDVSEAVVEALVAQKNESFGVFELLLECKKMVSNHSILNALVDSISHRMGRKRADIESFFLYVSELENLEDRNSFEAFLRLCEGDIFLQAFSYRKALSLGLPQDLLSCFPIAEFRTLPGWIAFFGFQRSMLQQLAVAALNQHDFLVLLHNTGRELARDIYSHYVRNYRRGNCDSNLVVNTLVARMLEDENGPVSTIFYKQFSRENAAAVLRQLHGQDRDGFFVLLLRLQKKKELLSVVDGVVPELVQSGISGDDILQLFCAVRKTPLEELIVRFSRRLLSGGDLEKFLRAVVEETGSIRVLNEAARAACYGEKKETFGEEKVSARAQNDVSSDESAKASDEKANSSVEKTFSPESALENAPSAPVATPETLSRALNFSLENQPDTPEPSPGAKILTGILHRIVSLSLGPGDFHSAFSEAQPAARTRFHNGIRGLGQTLSNLETQHIGLTLNHLHRFLVQNYSAFGQEYVMRELTTNMARFIHRKDPSPASIGTLGLILKSLNFNCRALQCAIYRYMVEDEPARAEKLLSVHAGNRGWLANDVMAAIQAGILSSKKGDPWVKLSTFSAFRTQAASLGYRGEIQPSTAIRAIEVAQKVPPGLAHHEAIAWVWKLAEEKKIPHPVRQHWKRKKHAFSVNRRRNSGHVQ